MKEQVKQAFTIAAALAIIVTVAGAILAIINPSAEPFDRYIAHVAFIAGTLGIAGGIGATAYRTPAAPTEDDSGE